MIHDIYCTKAQYNPHDSVYLNLELDGPHSLFLTVKCLHDIVFTIETSVEPDKNSIATLYIGSFDIGGYGIDVCLEDGSYLFTAFDVASNRTDYPRYGFLSEFGPEADGTEAINQLSKYHITMIQFYDWMYRHHELMPPEEIFIDAMGRNLSIESVRNKITLCKEKNMLAIGYAAIYGAEKEYVDIHPEQIMYREDGKPHTLIDFIYMMDFDVNKPWSTHIAKQFQKAIEAMGFDGLHLDQYGYPKYAFEYLSRRVFNVEDAFEPFINKVRSYVDEVAGEKSKKPVLLFNSVNNWPVGKVAKSQVDAVYIEVWSPYDTYLHLVRIIEDARGYGNGKPVILSAYLKPFSNRENTQLEKIHQCFKLVTATIYSTGGYHLVLGEYCGMLQDAYYADHGVYDMEFSKVIRRYYDYIVRYRDLFHDKALENVSMNYSGGIIGDYFCQEHPVSSDARPGTLWLNVKKKPGRKVIDVINLLDQENSLWNVEKTPVTILHNISIILLNEPVDSIYIMSPDGDDPSMKEIEPVQVPHFCGMAYKVTIPKIVTWTSILINEKLDNE